MSTSMQNQIKNCCRSIYDGIEFFYVIPIVLHIILTYMYNTNTPHSDYILFWLNIACSTRIARKVYKIIVSTCNSTSAMGS